MKFIHQVKPNNLNYCKLKSDTLMEDKEFREKVQSRSFFYYLEKKIRKLKINDTELSLD